jgi:hypothetical protein
VDSRAPGRIRSASCRPSSDGPSWAPRPRRWRRAGPPSRTGRQASTKLHGDFQAAHILGDRWIGPTGAAGRAEIDLDGQRRGPALLVNWGPAMGRCDLPHAPPGVAPRRNANRRRGARSLIRAATWTSGGQRAVSLAIAPRLVRSPWQHLLDPTSALALVSLQTLKPGRLPETSLARAPSSAWRTATWPAACRHGARDAKPRPGPLRRDPPRPCRAIELRAQPAPAAPASTAPHEAVRIAKAHRSASAGQQTRQSRCTPLRRSNAVDAGGAELPLVHSWPLPPRNPTPAGKPAPRARLEAPPAARRRRRDPTSPATPTLADARLVPTLARPPATVPLAAHLAPPRRPPADVPRRPPRPLLRGRGPPSPAP